jgi:hypothetical protein
MQVYDGIQDGMTTDDDDYEDANFEHEILSRHRYLDCIGIQSEFCEFFVTLSCLHRCYILCIIVLWYLEYKCMHFVFDCWFLDLRFHIVLAKGNATVISLAFRFLFLEVSCECMRVCMWCNVG